MNRGVLLLGAIVVAGMALYPPWNCVAGAGDRKFVERSAGYAPIYDPPDKPYIPSSGSRLYADVGQAGCRAEIGWAQLGIQCGAAVVLTLGLALVKKK